MKSVMTHKFSQVPQANIPRSSFNRSHGFKTTFDGGYLVPVFVDEALPGDTFNLSMTSFARLATPIVPVMDNLSMDVFFFAVPNRLVWENWQKFNGERTPNPDSSIDFQVPIMAAPATVGHVVGSLSDYFGIPTDIPDLEHIALFHRSYNLIWNEWFRDQNLQNSVVVDIDDAASDTADYTLLRRGKRHDYFTSSLPWPQKGDSVDLPLGTSAKIKYDGTASGAALSVVDGSDADVRISTSTSEAITTSTPQTSPDYDLYADLSTATAATINSLRQAFQLQKLLERDARGGSRYTEIIRSHFGVTSPDQRLQRPEYLGGGTTRINIHPVAQTTSTDVTTPQGNLAAFGTASHDNVGFTKSFTEHCLVIGLISVRADLNYQQGLNRMWSRDTRFDYYWPALAHIGEQAVLNKEIYAQGSDNPTEDADVFGYQERYAEYRYKPSLITGQFRSTYAQTLHVWHLAQKFDALPELGDTFIQDTPPLDRMIAVQDEPHLLLDAYFNFNCVRPMPTYSVPGLIDHF